MLVRTDSSLFLSLSFSPSLRHECCGWRDLRLRDLFVAGEFAEVNRNEEPLSLGINITDIDTTLVGEQDPVSLENI